MTERCTRGTGRARIVESAMHLIGTRGVGAVRLRDVAEYAGVSLGSTTYHFNDRDELICAAFEYRANTVEGWTNHVLGDPWVTIVELLTAIRNPYCDPVWRRGQMEFYAEGSRNELVWPLAQRSIAAIELVLQRAYEIQDVDPEPGIAATRGRCILDGIALTAFRPDADFDSGFWLFEMLPGFLDLPGELV